MSRDEREIVTDSGIAIEPVSDPLAGGRVDNDPLGQQHAPIEAAQGLHAQESPLVGMPDQEPDFVHVRGDEDDRPTGAVSGRDQVTQPVGAHLIDHRANFIFESRNARDVAQPPLQLDVHAPVRSSSTMP